MHRLNPLLHIILLASSLAATVVAAEPPRLAPCVTGYPGGDFLVFTEQVVLDVLTTMPEPLQARDAVTVSEWSAALGTQKPPIEITDEMTAALIVKLASGRWAVVGSNVTYVRRAAISVVDERQGMLHFMPSTPAPAAGGKGVGALAQPHAHGVTVVAASGRIFCGVRSLGRLLSVTGADVEAVAGLVQPPDAAAMIAWVAGR
jgi:hypothetical protein